MPARLSRRPLWRMLGAAVVLLLASWGCGELVRSYAGALDLRAVRDLVAVRTPALTAAAQTLSAIGSGYVVFPLAAVSCAALYRAGRRRAGAVVALSTIGAVALANLDKLLVGRPRPPVRHLELVTSASFPSGHASQSTGLYVAAALVGLASAATHRRLAAALLGLAVLLVAAVCWSRIYLGVHYPTDVAAGAVLAGLWLAVVWRITGGPERPARPGA